MSRDAYCPHCGDHRRTVTGKPWLGTICRGCGRTLTESSSPI